MVAPASSKRVPRTDLTGKVFGRLTVLCYEGTKREHLWRCRCTCGKEIVTLQSSLLFGKTNSCGCLRSEVSRNNINHTLHRVDGTCIERIAAKVTLKNNTSGFRGVSMRKNGTFRVSITFKGKRYSLGTYLTLEEAIEARLAGEVMVDEFVESYRNRDSDKENPDRALALRHSRDAEHET